MADIVTNTLQIGNDNLILRDADAQEKVTGLKEDLYGFTDAEFDSVYDGYYNNANYISSTTIKTYYFDVSGIDTIKISGTFTAYTNVYTLFDSSDNILSYLRVSSETTDTYTIDTTNAVKVGVSNHNNNVNSLSCNVFVPKADVQNDEIKDIKADAALDVVQNGIGTRTGQEAGYYNQTVWTESSTYRTDSYDVKDIESVVISGTYSAYVNAYTLLDRFGKIISFQRFTAITDIPITVDVSEASVIKVSYHQSNRTRVMSGKTSRSNPWKGRTIVWYGTSIPAAGYVGLGRANSYPMMIGDMLEATVYNEAIGSSGMHCKTPDRVDATTNPYGFTANRESCSRCLTNTREEMQWIIDHQNDPIWTEGLTPLAEGQVLLNSYENKVDKYLTGNSFPDLFVFDHGHNDVFDTPAEQEEYYSQYGEYSLFTFRGAMNFIIKRILDYNPRAKIVMIGEYTGTDQTSVQQIQLPVARDWQLPFLKQWERLGWTKTQTVSPFGSWGYNSTSNKWEWITDTTRHTMTVFQAWIPDNIHPHTDDSGRALRKMAYEIAAWLTNEVSLY